MKSVKVQICFGTHCTMMGAMDIMQFVTDLKEGLKDKEIDIEVVKCFGNCKSDQDAPVVMINNCRLSSATTEKVMAKIMEEVQQ